MKHEPRHALKKPSRGKFAAKSLAAAAAITLPFLGFAAPANADNGGTWDQLAQCESGGNWSIDTGNGYRGGLQFAQSTWEAYGGSGNPANASREQQISVAENVLEGQGWGAWPACSAQLGLSGNDAPQGGSGSSGESQQTVSQQQEQPAQQQQQQTSAEQEQPTQQQAPAQQEEQPVQQQSQPAPQQQTAAHSGETYTVKAGDTLSKIAQAHNVSGGWERLYEVNADKIADPTLIYPGQTLVLP